MFNEIIGEDADEDISFGGEGVVVGAGDDEFFGNELELIGKDADEDTSFVREGVVAREVDDELFGNGLELQGDEFGDDEGDEFVVEDMHTYLV